MPILIIFAKDPMAMADEPHPYRIIVGDSFLDELGAILKQLKLSGNLSHRSQVLRHALRLDELIHNPRHPDHWTYRVIVYRDHEGRVLQYQAVPNDMELDKDDLRRVQYVIDHPLHEGEVPSGEIWGRLVNFYRVDESRVADVGYGEVFLISIELL